MLCINLYQKSSDIHPLEFITDRELTSVVVCSTPNMADDFRANALKLGVSGDRVNVVTINQYIKVELRKIFEQNPLKRKVDIIIDLSIAWKKFFPTLSYEVFAQAFNIFSDLRGHTLDFDLLTEILPEFDERIANGVQLFQQLIESTEVIDEHRAHALIAESYREPEHKIFDEYESQNVIFYGMTHLSSGQVDMLKAVAIHNDVYVPIPESVVENSSDSDWFNWLGVDRSEMLKIGDGNLVVEVCEGIGYVKGRLGEAIRNRFSEDSEDRDYFLAVKSPSFGQLAEIPVNNLYFKSETDLCGDKLQIVFKRVKEEHLFDESCRIKVDDLLDGLRGSVRDLIEESSQSKDYLEIKAYSLIVKAIEKWRERSDLNIEMGVFDFKLIEEVASLIVPRTFQIPLLFDGVKGSVRGLEGLDSFHEERSAVVCVSSEYAPLYSSGNRYNDEVLRFLASIGPVRRSDLDFQFVKNSFLNILRRENTTLFIENGITDSDLVWNEILEELGQVEWCGQTEFSGRETKDHLLPTITKHSGKLRNFSATRLQTFLKCPRLYYFKYIEKISQRIQLNEDLMVSELGTLEHAVIKEYWDNHDSFDFDLHRQVTGVYFKRYLAESGIELSLFDYERHLLEVENFSRNGLISLYILKKIDPTLSCKLEYDLGKQGVTGSIDCFLSGNFGHAVLDFKRSKSSIPTENALVKLQDIQLWFYMNHLDCESDKYAFWGHVNLSDPKESQIFIKDSLLKERLVNENFLSGVKLNNDKGTEIISILKEYEEFESNLVEKIEKEKTFAPVPQTASSCRYCVVKNICPRGEL